MDYEKEYKSLVAKVKKAHQFAQTDSTKNVLEDILPELRESEDERMIRKIESFLSAYGADYFINGEWREIEVWLEKQKENPKNAISIPADCATNAKCEDRWHKTANSLPDDGRDVLAKDAIGNYLLASFDGAQWFVSVYDGEDHPVLHTPPILEWCEIPSEKQKEQKPIGGIYWHAIKKGEKLPCRAYVWNRDFEKYPDCWEGRLIPNLEKICVGIDTWYLPAKDVRDLPREGIDELPEEQKEQKPAWSEEDERRIDAICELLENTSSIHPNYSSRKLIIWLKSLRPSWKPSDQDELMKLKYAGTSTKLD